MYLLASYLALTWPFLLSANDTGAALHSIASQSGEYRHNIGLYDLATVYEIRSFKQGIDDSINYIRGGYPSYFTFNIISIPRCGFCYRFFEKTG